MLFGRRLGRCDICMPYTLSLFAVADKIVAAHPRIRDRSVCLLVAIHPLPASEEGEFRNILLNIGKFAVFYHKNNPVDYSH